MIETTEYNLAISSEIDKFKLFLMFVLLFNIMMCNKIKVNLGNIVINKMQSPVKR